MPTHFAFPIQKVQCWWNHKLQKRSLGPFLPALINDGLGCGVYHTVGVDLQAEPQKSENTVHPNNELLAPRLLSTHASTADWLAAAVGNILAEPLSNRARCWSGDCETINMDNICAHFSSTLQSVDADAKNRGVLEPGHRAPALGFLGEWKIAGAFHENISFFLWVETG